jgi:hypothetical protein
VLVGALVALLALVGGAVAVAMGGDDGETSAATGETGASGEIFLQAASDSGPDPFAPSVANKAPTSTIPNTTRITLGPKTASAPAPTAPVFTPGPLAQPGSTTAITALSGGTPGLYGGTLNQASCDKQKMIDFLAANSDKAQAWAGVQGIAVGDIDSYINGLTSVQLRSDTRVTNHGYVDGRATEHQDILQAGTAVMIDQYGVPRARCACGNPLLPPRPVTTTPSYQGTPWTGFNPGNVTVIDASVTIIKTITIINVTNGKLIGRRVGPSTGPDRQLPGRPRPPRTATTTTTLPGFTPPGNTLPPYTPPANTLPPYTPPANTLPPVTQPPVTQPAGDLVLVSSSKVDGELASSWTVNKDAGTAKIEIPANVNVGSYSWTVPQRIPTGGVTISWGASSIGNVHVAITPSGDELVFGRSDLTVESDGPAGQKSTLVRPTGAAQEAKLIISTYFGPTITYVYRR